MEKEIIEIEEYSKTDRKPPKGQRYQIRIDRETYVVDVESMTGREILDLAQKHPVERYRLDQKLRGGDVRKIALDESVDFTEPGVERFLTFRLEHTDGRDNELRRQFELSEEDTQQLNAQGFPWETLVQGHERWVLVHNFSLPPGYTITASSIAVQITDGYPTAGLDMAYFYPHLARTDGKIINSLCEHPIDGKQWQRWSRHRTEPWRPEIDTIASHIRLATEWLSNEFQK